MLKKKVNQDLHDSRKDSAEARQKMLAKFRAAPGPNDPALIESRRQREAVAEARVARQADREQARQASEAEAARQAEIAAKLASEAAARIAADEAERATALAAEQKAARDERYAARKMAKKERRKGSGSGR